MKNLDFLSFLLGILSTIIIPLCIAAYNKFERKYKINRFRHFVFSEYVEDITYLSDQEKLFDNIKRLNYLKDEEIIHINKYCFEYIRIIEFSTMFLKQSLDIVKNYDLQKEKNKHLELEKLKNKYINNLKNYYELKIDHL